MPGSVWMWQAACHIRKLRRKGTVRQARVSTVRCDILVGKSFSEGYFEMPNPFQVPLAHISLVFLCSKAGTFPLSFWGAWLYSFSHYSGLNAFSFWLRLGCDSAQGCRWRGHSWRPASPSRIKVKTRVVDEGWTVRYERFSLYAKAAPLFVFLIYEDLGRYAEIRFGVAGVFHARGQTRGFLPDHHHFPDPNQSAWVQKMWEQELASSDLEEKDRDRRKYLWDGECIIYSSKIMIQKN